MGQIFCNARGCERSLMIPRVSLEGQSSSVTCNTCKQVALCVDHFSVLWKKGGRCPKCNSQEWTVNLFEGEPFSPMLQAELIAKGGTLKIIETQAKTPINSQTSFESKREALLQEPSQDFTHNDQYLQALAESSQDRSMVTMNVAAKSHQQMTRATFNAQAPHPRQDLSQDPYEQALGQSVGAQATTYRNENYSIPSGGETNVALSDGLAPPPRGWRLVTQADLSPQARGLGDGIAVERQGETLVRMMDDDRIIRQIELEGNIIHVSQSPRKQRLIVERSRDGQHEVIYFRGRELQGFITNPVSDDHDMFGAKFFSETGFVIFTERPDERLDLREGRFKKSRQVQTRVVGSSVKAVPLPPSICQKGTLAFFFKGVSENRFLPVCRRISNGDDVVIGGELNERPVTQAASTEAMTLSWMTRNGDIWVNSGSHHPTQCVSQSNASQLAVSSDGRQVAWVSDTSFYTYSVDQRRVEKWSAPQGLLAIGWRGQI